MNNKLYNMSFENKKLLEKNNECVCFNCKKVFDVKKIEDWIEDNNDFTAQCPYCSIDSVIPKRINNVEILDEEIEKLNNIYFS